MRYAIVFVLLAGCATNQEMVWVHPTAGEQQFQMDRGGCVAQSSSVPFAPPLQQAIVFTGCMQSKGWQRVRADQPSTQEPKDQLHSCGDIAERVSGTKDSFSSTYKAAFDGCMAKN